MSRLLIYGRNVQLAPAARQKVASGGELWRRHWTTPHKSRSPGKGDRATTKITESTRQRGYAALTCSITDKSLVIFYRPYQYHDLISSAVTGQRISTERFCFRIRKAATGCRTPKPRISKGLARMRSADYLMVVLPETAVATEVS